MNRRNFFRWAGLAAGGAALALHRPIALAQDGVAVATQAPGADAASRSTRVFPGGQPSVITPNGATLPMVERDGVWIGHLVAEPVTHEFAPGLIGECWGYNGRVHGPTIEVVEGDRVRFYVSNRLPEATTVHWHGVELPNGMDGVSGLTQPRIEPGETYVYEFTLRRPGTFMYHSHYDEMTQMAMGMVGMFIVHPRRPVGRPVDHDFALMTHEWLIRPGHRRPDPMAMSDFNVLTFNAKSYPATEPLVVRTGARVRIRLGNLSAMDHHPIHLHGPPFRVTATDGGEIPVAGQWPETTVLVPVGGTRVVELDAIDPGDWAMHCHMTHHVMTQMGHEVPNLLGADEARITNAIAPLVPGYMTMGHDGMGAMAEMRMPVPRNSIPMQGSPGPFGSIDMGGMFTVMKVRDVIEPDSATTWYRHPPGTVARAATDGELERDGIAPPRR